MKLVLSRGCLVVPDETSSVSSARMGWLNDGEVKAWWCGLAVVWSSMDEDEGGLS